MGRRGEGKGRKALLLESLLPPPPPFDSLTSMPASQQLEARSLTPEVEDSF